MPILLILLLLAPFSALAETRIPSTTSEISIGFAPLVKKAAPAVVNIYAKRFVQEQSPFAGDPFFEDFFRGFGAPRPRVQNSLGSGVILGADGIVVSNFHVVGQATDIRVVLADRREFAARLLLGDAESDIAILKLAEAENLPTLPLRDSDRVEVGELVLAIGNPFGVGQTVSSGIVSGLARSGIALGNARGYFIQTDAPINPGNSGGALVDVNGALIGINTAILSRSGGSNGIGFAIPANLVSQFVSQARAGNTIFQRPWAGIAGQPVDFDLARSMELPTPTGLLISDIHPLSPFAKVGFAVGDVITAVDGLQVNSPSEMLFRMSVRGIGGTANVERMKNGRVESLDVQLGLAPDEPNSNETTLSRKTALPDLTVAQVNPMQMARFGLPLSLSGVVVTDPGLVGAQVGLQPGDVLGAVNGTFMETPEDVQKALQKPGRRVQLEIIRQSRRLTLRFRT